MSAVGEANNKDTIKELAVGIHKGGSEKDVKRQRSLANLRPCKKGQTNNPKGRPKTKLLKDHVLSFFNQDPKKCIQDLYTERIDLFFAYGFGKPTDVLEVSGPNGSQLVPSEMILAAALIAKEL
jgi:hypothetical protein